MNENRRRSNAVNPIADEEEREVASLSKDKNGNYTVQVVGGDGKRRSVRLGKINKKLATEIRLKTEHLNSLAIMNLPIDGETSAWVARIGDDLAAKLHAAKLIAPRSSLKLGEFLAAYLVRRRADSKPATVVTIERVVVDLNAFFGESTSLREITELRADAFRTHYLGRKLASATRSRRLKNARMMFKHAVRMKLLPANPFAEVSTQSVNPKDRQHYVAPDETVRIIEACNPTWRIIVALCRFAGLRCPSEVLSLKWEHVNFETNRMTVPSCKTEHLPGKAYRTVPIFAALRPYLQEAFELATDGAEYVVPGTYRESANTEKGWINCNLRTQFLKIIRRAGLQFWPRLFHNLRASCETDLMKDHPIHAVCEWIGNTPNIALKHYLQVLDSDFAKATSGGAESGAVVVQNPVQSASANKRQEETASQNKLQNKQFGRSQPLAVSSRHTIEMGDKGLEPLTSSL